MESLSRCTLGKGIFILNEVFVVFLLAVSTACGLSAPAQIPATPLAITQESSEIPSTPLPTDIQDQLSVVTAPYPTLEVETAQETPVSLDLDASEIQPEISSVSPELCSPLGEHPLDELPQIVSAPYHPPPPGKEERHHGVDFSYYRRGDRMTIQGMGVQAMLPGRVAASLADSFPYGNTLIMESVADTLTPAIVDEIGLQAGESLYVLYAHMEDAPDLSIGDPVHACQPLGTVGKSGNAGIAHLHLETRIGPAGAVFEGMLFYSTQASEMEMANYLLWRTSGVFRHFDPILLLSVP